MHEIYLASLVVLNDERDPVVGYLCRCEGVALDARLTLNGCTLLRRRSEWSFIRLGWRVLRETPDPTDPY